MNSRLLFLTIAITAITTLRAQIVNTLPTPPPRVNPDLTVTYFLNAPDAKEVRLGDTVHSPGPPGIPMTKGADGIWSVTTPPYEIGTHQYAFVIDGVITGSIFSTEAGERLPRPSVLFETIDVRGSEPLFTDVQQVPHGTVQIETFSSATLNREVRVFVYTPPDFSRGEALPVVYLLHGNQGDERHWSLIGYSERIADNLIAAGQASRVILAMPDTSGPNRGPLPQDRIEPYLLFEVFPFVEGNTLVESHPRDILPDSRQARTTRGSPDCGTHLCSQVWVCFLGEGWPWGTWKSYTLQYASQNSFST